MKHATILIVEDTDNHQALFKRILNKHYHVNVSSSGAEALAAPQADLVILDYNLPDITGLELSKHFKQLNTPFIFLTADGSNETAEKLNRAGAYGYLVKPINNETLLQTVTTALDRSKDVVNLLSSAEKARRWNFVYAAAGLILQNGFEEIDDAMDYIKSIARKKGLSPFDLAMRIIEAHDYFKSFRPSN